MSIRSGRAARELDDDIRDKDEADRRLAHELATTARLNAQRLAEHDVQEALRRQMNAEAGDEEHETQEAHRRQMEDIHVREADRRCALERKEARGLEVSRKA